MRRSDKVKGPILIPFSLVLLLAIGTLLTVAYHYEEQARAHDLAESVRAVERLFELQIDNHAAKLQATLCPISRDEGVKGAFHGGDRDALLMQVEPLFQRLRDHHRVTHFYILDAERRVVLRVHQPDMFGDIVERATTLQAEQLGQESRGIDLGPLGTLTLRSVKPWYQGDRLIGYLELGEEIDRVIQEIHNALGVDLLVVVHRRYLELPDQAVVSGDPDAPVVVSSTLASVPPAVAARLGGAGSADRAAREVAAGDRSLYTALLPLLDAAGREVGDIVVVRDVTALQAGFRQSLALAAVLSLLAGGLVFALFYVILGRVEKDYRRQREMETRFARLSTEHQRIVQIEKLSEVGRTIGEIAHQINNPLVGVVNMAQLAEREADDPVRVRELLGDIRRAGSDCHAFLERMLAFTRVSRSERRPTDIRELIGDTLLLFRQSTNRHAHIAAELPEEGAILDVDPVLVRHALFNLLANAAQASPPVGAITVSLQPEVGPEQQPGWSLEVQDQGPGLSAAVREKLFTPFFTTRPSGTGLGLAVVQHVANLHDGSVSADNRPTGGAVFAIWLPTTCVDAGTAS